MKRNSRNGTVSLIALALLAATLTCGGCGSDDDSSPTQPPTPTPTWSNADITWTAPYAADGSFPSTLSYLKTGTTVMLQGMANAGSTKVQSGQVIGTLPEDCRPPAAESVIVLCPTWGWPTGYQDGYVGVAGLVILPDGRMIVRTVQQFDGQLQFIELDGISFATVTGSDGWTNTGITWASPYSTDGDYPSTLEYRKTGTLVELRGFANAGNNRVTAGDIIGTLPEGCRPPGSNSVILPTATWGWPAGYFDGYVGTAGIFIFSDGTIQVQTVQQFDGQLQFLSLDGLCFSTAEASDGWTSEGLVYNLPYSTSTPYPSSLQFLESGNTVFLQGFGNAGSAKVQTGQTVGVLPEGYRPPTGDSIFMLCPTWGWPTGHQDGYVGTAGLIVSNTGSMDVRTVHQFDGEMQYLQLDGKRFSVSWVAP